MADLRVPSASDNLSIAAPSCDGCDSTSVSGPPLKLVGGRRLCIGCRFDAPITRAPSASPPPPPAAPAGEGSAAVVSGGAKAEVAQIHAAIVDDLKAIASLTARPDFFGVTLDSTGRIQATRPAWLDLPAAVHANARQLSAPPFEGCDPHESADAHRAMLRRVA